MPVINDVESVLSYVNSLSCETCIYSFTAADSRLYCALERMSSKRKIYPVASSEFCSAGSWVVENQGKYDVMDRKRALLQLFNSEKDAELVDRVSALEDEVKRLQKLLDQIPLMRFMHG